MLYALLKEGATSLPSNQQLGSDTIQIHHIFPKALLKGMYAEELMEDVANKTFVVWKENIRVGSREPIEYIWGKVRSEALEAHFIPQQPDLLRSGEFEKFIEGGRS